MVLFSRAFIRKRVISLATSASVAATSFALAQDPAKTHHVRGGRQYAPDQQEYSEVQPLLSAKAATTTRKMMADMVIRSTGDIDRDFVEMTPHHGAVDVVQTELEYGRNERLHWLAQRIGATQQREITIMQNAVSDRKPSGAQSPEQSLAVLLQPGPIAGSVSRGEMKVSQ